MSARERANNGRDNNSPLDYLRKYAAKVARGRLSAHVAIEDFKQQVLLEWWEVYGTVQGAQLRLLKKDSSERRFLRKAVFRVIQRLNYRANQNAKQQPLCCGPPPATPVSQLVDIELDLVEAFTSLTDLQREIFDLRRKNYTYAEIAQELNLSSKQKAWRELEGAKAVLSSIISKKGGD